MSNRKVYVGNRIKNFIVINKTNKKRTRKDGRNFFIYECRCDCGTLFESTVAEFDYKFGCNDCAKQHHYEMTVISRKNNINLTPSRRTELSKLSPESKDGIKGSYANHVINSIKSTATKRNLSWNLDFIKAFYLIQEPCYYCGNEVKFPETRNGLDRLDNSKGYIENNVVPCCYPCNIAKHEMSENEFKSFIIKIYDNWASK